MADPHCHTLPGQCGKWQGNRHCHTAWAVGHVASGRRPGRLGAGPGRRRRLAAAWGFVLVYLVYLVYTCIYLYKFVYICIYFNVLGIELVLN